MVHIETTYKNLMLVSILDSTLLLDLTSKSEGENLVYFV